MSAQVVLLGGRLLQRFARYQPVSATNAPAQNSLDTQLLHLLLQIVKRNIQAHTGVDISNEDISAQTQSMTWTKEVTRDNTDQKDDSGWETDLELEGKILSL